VAARADSDSETGFLRWLGELVVLVGLAFVLAMGIRGFVVQPFWIPTGSMIPTLEVDDRVLANKFVYRFSSPAPGDIVVFPSPNGDGSDLIKRVIAVEGQTIDIQNGQVFVDGEALSEEFVNEAAPDDSTLAEPITVPTDHVFLMGDNRANSADSRVFGPQPESALLGKAFMVYWPPARIRAL
jgi:signal peptidase I